MVGGTHAGMALHYSHPALLEEEAATPTCTSAVPSAVPLAPVQHMKVPRRIVAIEIGQGPDVEKIFLI